jgi:phage baseplate assembly protein W
MEKDFLGVGLGFPFKVEDGKMTWSEYERSIRESIMIILGTAYGERVMRPDFGCGLQELVFSVNDTSTASLAIFYVEEALKKWESRIEVIKVDAQTDPRENDRLNISIEYRDISTNTRNNLVYPFYLGRE